MTEPWRQDDLTVMATATGRVNHLCHEDDGAVSLCGVECVGPTNDRTAWTLCVKCERIASSRATGDVGA
jgi:hypothetical protein